MSSETRNTLYLCYFGLREPLVQTQVLPYLREIAKDDFTVHLLTFEPDFREKWTAEQIAEEKRKLVSEGIHWNCFPYHKSPSVPATLYDVFAGARYARRLIRQNGVSILHARAHVPVLMALAAKLSTSCKVIFDIRGLVAEEYADAGVWNEKSAGFRFTKKIETLGLKHADRIVVLTGKMKDYLVEKGLRVSEEISVVPCCVDFSRTSNDVEEAATKNERFELIYAGSVTGLYLLEEMGRFFLELKKRKEDAFFRVLTSTPNAVGKVFSNLGIAAGDFEASFVKPADVLFQVRKARLAISFRKPTFSQMAASPTKIPEYLAAGVAVVTNAGIGDMDAIIEQENVGVVVRNFDSASLSEAVDTALRLLREEEIAARCVNAAKEKFDLVNVGGKAYRRLYKGIFD